MSKYTPGPWQYLEWGARIVSSDIGSAQVLIATVAINTRRDEGRHNASVLAAAPDLLAMCEELAECADYWSEYDVPIGIVERLRAVIAKAKGES